MPSVAELTPLVSAMMVGILLAAAAGFRVFVPLFLTGIGLRLGVIPALADHSSLWLASTSAIICFGTATAVEILAYKVPYVDHLLDVAGAPAAMASGALLVTTMMSGIDVPALKYGLGALSGAGAAGAVHLGTSALRLLSTKTTAGLGNPFFAVSEAIASVTTTVMALIVPVVSFAILVLCLLVLVVFARRWARRGVNARL